MYAFRLRSSLFSRFPVARRFPAARRAPATPHVPATSPYEQPLRAAACTDLRGCRDRGGLRSRFLFAGEYPPAGCIGGLRLRDGSRVTWTVAGEEEYSGDSDSESEDSDSESEVSGDSDSESVEAGQVVDDVPPDHICPACLRDHESPRCPVCNMPFLSNKLMHRHFQEKHNNAELIADLVTKVVELLYQQPTEVLASLAEGILKNFGGN